MASNALASGFARLTPWQARAVLAAVGLAAAALVGVALSPLANDQTGVERSEPGDIALYRAEIERIRGGEGYYQAAAAELRARGYPTRSVFNWRTPLPIWFIGQLPTPEFGKALLGGLAILLLLTAFAAVARDSTPLPSPATTLRAVPGSGAGGEGTQRHHVPTTTTPLPLRAIVTALLLTGPLMLCLLGEIFVMPVLWAGVLIALSLCCNGVGRPGWGVACGIAAVFCRELALPFCLLMAALAGWNRRRGEAGAWLAGLTGWAVYFGLHAWQVAGLVRPDDLAHAHGWLQGGGASFVLATVQINAYLLLLPQWITALYLLAALVGLAGWRGAWGQRLGLTAAMYAAAFAVVGQPFNQYWGCLTAPLWCFGVAAFPAALGDLVAAARLRTPALAQSAR